jgi:hypothetical protein
VALIGALTPLGKVAQTRGMWFRCAIAYLVTGSVSACVVGAGLGVLGNIMLSLGPIGRVRFLFVSVLALILGARELGLITFALPERKRQTEKVFANQYGLLIASAMWGAHIGLGFATRVTFGGFWFLVAITLAVGEPGYGAIVMLFYWLGRALPVLLGPRLLPDQLPPTQIVPTLAPGRLWYRHIAGIALMWSAGVAALLVI